MNMAGEHWNKWECCQLLWGEVSFHSKYLRGWVLVILDMAYFQNTFFDYNMNPHCKVGCQQMHAAKPGRNILSLIWDLHSKTWLTYQWHDLFWDSIWDNRRWGIPAGPQTWCSGNKQLLWAESNTVSLVSLRSRWPTPEQWRWHSPWQKWRSLSWVLHWHGSEQHEISRLWSYNSCYVQTLIFSATIILSAFLRWYVVMEMT